VCGKDGKTYSNLCFLECADVPLAYLGKCNSTNSNPNTKPNTKPNVITAHVTSEKANAKATEAIATPNVAEKIRKPKPQNEQKMLL